MEELLSERAVQFRAIQRRLLTRFRDKTPAPLQHLDTLLDGTYKQVSAMSGQMCVSTPVSSFPRVRRQGTDICWTVGSGCVCDAFGVAYKYSFSSLFSQETTTCSQYLYDYNEDLGLLVSSWVSTWDHYFVLKIILAVFTL